MTFSRHELHGDQEFEQARLLSVDRRHNGLNVNPGANNYVVTVSDDDDQLDDALRAAGADILGQQYPYAHAGLARHALRATSQGAGRPRWR